MTRLEHVSLPAGLSAIARWGENGELTITVSAALEPGQQRDAVRVALRAARRHSWPLGLLPVPAFAFLPAIRASLRNLGRVVRAHAAATAVVTSSVVLGVAGAAVMVATAPHAHTGAGSAPGAAPSYRPSPAAGQPVGPRQGNAARPGAAPPSRAGSTGPGVVAVATHSAAPRPAPSPSASTQPSSGPAPSEPAPSPPPPAASPSPSPSSSPPSSGGGGHCIDLLGVVICL